MQYNFYVALEKEVTRLWLRAVDEISRNIYFVFREIIFFISRNFAKFRIEKYYKISRNFAKYREIFCDEIKMSIKIDSLCIGFEKFT
jgi:hypothetical protein